MIDILSLFQLLIDFGLVILILMVQRTIYPSFIYFKREDLVAWHIKYTSQIAKIVGPLMLAQLGLASYFFIIKQQYYLIGGIYLTLVVATWVSTALQFVPIHNRITKNTHTDIDLKKLVRKNWLRVILWTLILVTNTIAYTTSVL